MLSREQMGGPQRTVPKYQQTHGVYPAAESTPNQRRGGAEDPALMEKPEHDFEMGQRDWWGTGTFWGWMPCVHQSYMSKAMDKASQGYLAMKSYGVKNPGLKMRDLEGMKAQ